MALRLFQKKIQNKLIVCQDIPSQSIEHAQSYSEQIPTLLRRSIFFELVIFAKEIDILLLERQIQSHMRIFAQKQSEPEQKNTTKTITKHLTT